MDGVIYTIEEYVQLENHSELKHEFVEGQIRLTSGGTLEHSRLAAAIIRQLSNQLDGRPCEVYTSDSRVRITAPEVITYPDVSVGCGTPQMDTADRYAQLNPTVLIEVTSPSSENYDRGKKFSYYQHIPSLREYVIVEQDERAIDVFRRGLDGRWDTEAAHYGAGERAPLRSIGCELDVDTLYFDRRKPVS